MVETKTKEASKRVCECPDCDNPRARPLMSEDGRHNFIAHIIDGEIKNVCITCKIELLRGQRQRNGF